MHVSARYANSRLRILVLTAILAAAFLTLRPSLGQPAPAPPVTPAAGAPLTAVPVPPAPSTPAPALPAPAGPSAAVPAPAADSSSSAPANVDLLYIIMQNRDPVFFTIVLLSVIGVALIIQGIIKTRASVLMPQAATDHMRDLITRRRFQELLEYTTAEPSFVARSLAPALRRAPDFDRMKEAMETAIGEQTAEQFRRIEYLNIIGNLGPLLGLLGTVLGMINAFAVVWTEQGQASVPQLANGISKALCHTFLGLMLAIPCLAAFGVLRTLVDRLTISGSLLAEELLLMLKPAADATPRPGANRPVPAPAPAAPPASASAVS